MGHPDGAHTHGSGGFDAMPLLIIIGAIVLAGPVLAAVAELIHILLIVLAVLAGLAAVGVAALAAFHVHRWRTGGTSQRPLPAPPSQRAVQGAPAPRAVQAPREQRPAIEQHVHHHWHGISPEDIAAILNRRDDP
jgi:hypothetical protein